MSFIKKTVKHQDLGERLRVVRERLGLSPEDIAKVGKVQPKYLAALESGSFAELPATVYVKGFLRTLAQIYRLPAEPLLAEFVAEREVRDNVQLATTPLSPKSKLEIPRFVLSPRVLTISGVAFLGLVSLAYLYFQVSSLARPPRITLESPEETVVNSSLLAVTGHTERGASVYLNNQPIVVDASGNFHESLSLGAGMNTLVIRAVNKFGQETTMTRQVQYAPSAIAGSHTAATSTAVTLEVSVETRATQIEIRSDGADIFSGMIPAGTKQTFTAEEKISLTTSDAGATRVTVNGKPLGILGKAGESIKNIEFTR